MGAAGLRNRVLHLAHAGGQLLCAATTADVHEIDPRLVEKEMVMQRGHFQPGLERRAHCGIDFILEHDRVAHHHQLPVARRERRP